MVSENTKGKYKALHRTALPLRSISAGELGAVVSGTYDMILPFLSAYICADREWIWSGMIGDWKDEWD